MFGAGSLLGVVSINVKGHRNRNKKKKKKKNDSPCRPPNSQPCGPGCTDPVNRPCCNGVPCAVGHHCCPAGHCCPNGHGCDAPPDLCCGSDRTCGDQCCDPETPCDTRFTPAICCPVPRICGDTCCDAEETCARGMDPPTCCHLARICGDQCCAEGESCRFGTDPPRCCPAERTCGTTCCAEGEFCTFPPDPDPPTCCATNRTCGFICCDDEDQECCAANPDGSGNTSCCVIGRICAYDPRDRRVAASRAFRRAVVRVATIRLPTVATNPTTPATAARRTGVAVAPVVRNAVCSGRCRNPRDCSPPGLEHGAPAAVGTRSAHPDGTCGDRGPPSAASRSAGRREHDAQTSGVKHGRDWIAQAAVRYRAPVSKTTVCETVAGGPVSAQVYAGTAVAQPVSKSTILLLALLSRF